MKKIGVDPDLPLDEIKDKVADYLEIEGFDANYEPTDGGKICESILDWIGGQ